LLHAAQRPYGIDMAAHQMAAQGVAGTQTGLQIDLGTNGEFAQGGLGQRLARNVGKETAALLAGGGQTHPLHADAVADGDSRDVEPRGIHRQLEVSTLVVHRSDAAGRQYDASEHLCLFQVEGQAYIVADAANIAKFIGGERVGAKFGAQQWRGIIA
jgi:hypothetical protein